MLKKPKQKIHYTQFGLAIILILILAHSSVHAVLKETNPSIVCKFLIARGLSTGNWKDYGFGGSSAGNFGCSSPYQILDKGAARNNNLAYYVQGQASNVGLVYLMLNINNRSRAVAGHKALLDAATLLAEQATGKPLPNSIREAITLGKIASATSASTRIRVNRVEWPTGLGYEIKVSME